MSALEREIIEKFQQLQPDEKRRVRAFIEQEMTPEFDYAGWMRDMETLREQILAADGGTLPPIDVVEMLREMR